MEEINRFSGSQAIYFMPDISGFSGFVENTAIEHSIHIISELLEILLDENSTGMKLAEIEGDALFMYSENQLSLEDIEKQITSMLNSFRVHLSKYEDQRICNCGACSSAIDLKIKFLLHYGRLDFIKVRDYKKPYGQDVNRIHRLLKNDIPLDEYLLVSYKALKYFNIPYENQGFKRMETEYDIHIKPYYFKDLDEYKIELPDKPNITNNKLQPEPDLIIEQDITAQVEDLYRLIGEFKYRKLWEKSLSGIEYKDNKVNRIGAQHTCVIGNRKIDFKTMEVMNYKADRSYAEFTKDFPMSRNYQFYMLLDKISETQTRVKVLNFIELNWIGKLFRKSVHKKLEKTWNENLRNLENLARKYQI